MPGRRGSPSTPRIVFGLLVLTVGVLFLLDNLGILNAGHVLRLWPAGLIAIGIAVLSQPDRSGGRLSGWIWIVIGGWLLAGELGIIHVRFWDFWPLVLVLIGGSIIWRALAPGAPRGAGGDDEATVRALAVMSGIERTSTSREFRGGELTAVMGGCEIDLRGATIGEGPAVIDVFAVWGGIEIRVPERWAVENRVFPFLGGVEDRTRPAPDATQRLVVKGTVVMGGVEIKN